MGYFYGHLAHYERDQIGLLRAEGFSFNAIGEILNRAGSTISREFHRNKLTENTYLPATAQNMAEERKSASGVRKAKCAPYKDKIYQYLSLGWAPAQAASELRKIIPNFHISHETIYQYIYKYQMNWAVLLPRKHEPRWFRGMGKKQGKKEMIPNRTCITERPEFINNKSEFGHWEGDSIVSSKSVVSLNVMVERQTQYVSIRRVENRGPEASVNAMLESLGRFKKRDRKSITFDNGIEFKYHEKLQSKLAMDTYFCQPYCSWEKGLVEQINGLIRRFLPKKTDLSLIDNKEIKLIEYLLNSRPRELLGWDTPAEAFAKKSKMKLVDGALAT